MRYKNPFNENMSVAEANEVLYQELEKTKTYKRLARLQGDYAAVMPTILRHEIDAFMDDLQNKSEKSKA